MEELLWEYEADEEAAAAEYYTKEEVDKLLSSLYKKLATAHNQVVDDIDDINERGSKLYKRLSNLVADLKKLEEAFKEMSEEVDKYLLLEKEEKKKKARERLNSGFYDFTDDEEDEENEL